MEERKLRNWTRGAIIGRELLLRWRVATISPLIERDSINRLTEYAAKARRKKERKRKRSATLAREGERATLATIIFRWRTRARLRGQEQGTTRGFVDRHPMKSGTSLNRISGDTQGFDVSRFRK